MNDDKVEPTVRDALIGFAIGLLILYGGTFISIRFLRWMTLGIGVVWVAVMAGFIGVVVATSLQRKLAPVTRKLRGHAMNDPALGPMHRDVRARSWRAHPIAGHPEIEFDVEGDAQPDARLLVRAREAAAGFDAIAQQVAAFVAAEAAAESEDQDLAAEMRALRIARVGLLTRDAPRTFLIELRGPDEDRYWTCLYDDRGPRDLDFD